MFNFENKPVYKDARRVVAKIYQLTATWPKTERYGLIDQIRRAAISIVLNIAEGFTRGSRAERKQFLRMSQGSVGEAIACLDLAFDLGYIDEKVRREVYDQLESIAKQLNALIFKP